MGDGYLLHCHEYVHYVGEADALTEGDQMSGDYLNHKLECKHCGTIYLDIPKAATENTIITCSTCHRVLGAWGELQDDFQWQDNAEAYSLDHGQIKRKRM